MTPWCFILIWCFSAGNGVTSGAAQFRTLESCQAAKQDMKSKIPYHRINYLECIKNY